MTNEPFFQLFPGNGGMNWGYCKEIVDNATTRYRAIVDTSNIEGSETKYFKVN